MHKQSGPPLRVLVLSQIQEVQIRQNVERQFEASPFERSTSSSFRRTTLVSRIGDGNHDVKEPTKLAVFQIDLLSELPPNILSKLVRRCPLSLNLKYVLYFSNSLSRRMSKIAKIRGRSGRLLLKTLKVRAKN
jgi:hypothetical protein